MTALPSPACQAISAPARSGWVQFLGAGRGVRVTALIVAIAAISLADLEMTILFLKNGGMSELNPLARWVISLNCAWLLGAWKVTLAGLCCTILFFTRKTRAAEIGAWVCALVMVWLACRWGAYADEAGSLGEAFHNLAQSGSPTWVELAN